MVDCSWSSKMVDDQIWICMRYEIGGRHCRCVRGRQKNRIDLYRIGAICIESERFVFIESERFVQNRSDLYRIGAICIESDQFVQNRIDLYLFGSTTKSTTKKFTTNSPAKSAQIPNLKQPKSGNTATITEQNSSIDRQSSPSQKPSQTLFYQSKVS